MSDEDNKKPASALDYGEAKEEKKEPVCPRCGLRSYDEVCQKCGTPIVDKKDDEDEDYNWREKYR